MTDEEYRQQVQQRWKESMALLGLDDAEPEPAPAKPAPAPPPPAEVPARHEPAVIHTPPPMREELPSREPWPPPEPDEPGAAEPPPVEMEALTPEDLGESMMDEPESATAPAPDRSEEKADRRPRGRRGRRGKRTDEPEGDAPARETDDDPKEKEDAKRGRPRRRTSKTVEADSGDKDETATIEAVTGGDFGEDEPTDLTEWDVPSWQDLIASLYRPER